MSETGPRPTVYLRAHAERFGEKLAVVDDRPDGTLTRWTFAELDCEARKLANVLIDLGVRPGDKVVWCGPNSPGVVRISHARQRVGAILVPLNYRFTPEEAAYVADDSDAVLAYVDAEYAPMFATMRDRIPKVREFVVFGGTAPAGMLDGDVLVARARDQEPPELDRAYPTTMFYTSGTTGRPKGALRPPTNPASVLPLLELIGHVPDDVYITTGPLYHSGPGGYFGIAHLLGNTVVLQRRFDPEDWLRLVAKYRVTMTFSAPAPIRLVCSLPAEVKTRYDRSSMRRMIANAAPWSFALKEAYMADFGEDSLWEVYGSTELGVNTALAPADQRRKPGSCGRPVPGVEIRLHDDAGREITEPNVPGEMFIRSTSAFLTYYKAEDEVRAASRGEFTSVGDVAYRDDEGFYYICDRKTDMIITGGMNVYPAEVEAALERHPDVADVAVFGIPSDEWGESVHAVVVPRAGATLTSGEVTSFARRHLAGYVAGRGQRAELLVPVGLEGVGHEAVPWIDDHVATLRQIRLDLGTLDGGAPQLIGLLVRRSISRRISRATLTAAGVTDGIVRVTLVVAVVHAAPRPAPLRTLTHAACWTVVHGFGPYAGPATTGCAIPTG